MRRLLFLALLAFAGCIAERSGMEKVTPSWQIGSTTRRAVVAKWGNPDIIDGEWWIWRDANTIGGKIKASFMMIGATISNLRDSTEEYRLTFDERGVLSGVEVVESVPKGADWSIWPW